MKKTFLAFLLGLFLVFGFASAASANLISNGSFELGAFDQTHGGTNTDQTMLLELGDTALTGWSITGEEIAWINTGNPYGLTASERDRFLDLTSWSAGGSGGVAQTVVTTVIGQSYALTFAVGSSVNYGGNADVLASAGSFSDHFTTNTSGTNQWDTFTLSFVADSTTTLIGLTGDGADHSGHYIGLDNVSLTAVPEPATMFLLSTGLIGLAGLRRRRFLKK